MESFDENKQRAKVAAGLKGGPFFKNPVQAPARTFVEGVPAEVKAKMFHQGIQQGNIEDPWYARRSK